MKLNRIPFDAVLEPGQRRAVFVIFYATDGQPWSDYVETDERKAGRSHLTIPSFLILHRCDGFLGFPGGKVEDHEELLEAAHREVKEEIGHDVVCELKPLLAHTLTTLSVFIYTAHISYAELQQIQVDAVKAEHFGSEINGAILPHLIDYDAKVGKGAGLVNFIKHSMIAKVRTEIVHFLIEREIFDKEELRAILAKADMRLEEMLD